MGATRRRVLGDGAPAGCAGALGSLLPLPHHPCSPRRNLVLATSHWVPRARLDETLGAGAAAAALFVAGWI